LLEYNKEIKLSDKLICGYQYFCDMHCPLANSSGYVYYHRYIASVKVGHWLSPEEHVHHIDGNKLNNDPDNLMILDHYEHGVMEQYRERENTELKRCIICGRIISINSNNFLCHICYNDKEEHSINNAYYLGLVCLGCGEPICNTNTSGFCMKCSFESKRLFNPSKDELEKLVWEIPTTKVAKIFGVSDKAIDKRCEILNISKPPRGYWSKKKAGKLINGLE
jgi:hypothetical protein